MATFSEHLRGRSDDELVDLLLRRPDLAHPSPATLSSLAARATSRPSLERALTGMDAAVLQAVESVVALLDGTGPGSTVRARDVAAAVGATARADVAAVKAALATATALALLQPSGRATDPALRPAPGLPELLGSYPAGLAPAEIGAPSGLPAPRAAAAAAATAAAADPTEIAAALAATGPGGRAVLDALTWGPPVGVRPESGPATEAVADLVARGLLVRPDSRHVLLPRTVALALRDGRTHPGPARPPELDDGPRRDAALVEAEQAAAAERAVRLLATLVRAWERTPPPVLRAGGLGVRDLRRVAQALEVAEPEAALVVELAGVGGLVRDDGEESPTYSPTLVADEWGSLDLPHRWARLVAWWLGTTRAAWLVGSRDDRGAVRAALGVEVARPWAPRLRASVLGVLADAGEGAVLSAADVVAALTWRTPRAVPPVDAVAAVLREAGWLGLLGAGALAPAGRTLVAGAGARTGPGARTRAGHGPVAAGDHAGEHLDPDLDALAAALDRALPSAVDDLLLQADLTGIVPGRPSADLEALLDASAQVESRGGAVTVRFTPESVRGALDAGTTADSLLADLARHSRGGVPQPLEYLVRDAARRHGRLRGGSVSSYVRTEDPALLAGLAEDPRHAGLGLVRLAPTVLAAQAPLAELLAALRAHGLAPVAETPDGQVLHAAPTVRRVAAARRRGPEDPAGSRGRGPVLPVDRATALVGVLRRAEEARAASSARTAAATGTTAGTTTGAVLGRGTGTGGSSAPGGPAGAGAIAEGDVTPSTTGRADPRTGASSRAGGGSRTTTARAPGSGSGSERATTAGAPAGTADPGEALGLLREAAAEHTEVWLEVVGSRGSLERRRVRPVRVDGGRVRVVDTGRDAEIVVAAHRIASVAPIAPPGSRPAPPADRSAPHDA